jgi:hypothetical protein
MSTTRCVDGEDEDVTTAPEPEPWHAARQLLIETADDRFALVARGLMFAAEDEMFAFGQRLPFVCDHRGHVGWSGLRLRLLPHAGTEAPVRQAEPASDHAPILDIP